MAGKTNKSGPIPALPKEIRRLIQGSENEFVVRVDDMIGRLNELSAHLPQQYDWRFRTVEAMRAEQRDLVAKAAGGLTINTLYWRDMLGNWQAHSVLSAFRVIDVARSCIWAIARQDTVCASLLARSALETAAAFLDTARTVSATINKQSPFVEPDFDLGTQYVTSVDLEEYSLKTIFSSRLKSSDDIYSPTNIVTIIARLSKIPTQEFVLPAYELLCEVAHPNWLGRSLYLQSSQPGPWEGNEIRTISRASGPTWHMLAEPMVAALSWACATQVSAFQLMTETISMVLARLEATKLST